LAPTDSADSHVDDDGLIIEDQGIGHPVVALPRLLEREPWLVSGRSVDLSGDRHASLEEEAGLPFLRNADAVL